jgi:hypothetical protein
VKTAANYWRADLNDLVTLIQLKLPPADSLPTSTAQQYNSIEADIKSWTASKPIIDARRLGPDGTRGIRMGDVIDLQARLSGRTGEPFPQDPKRETTITARVEHSLGSEPTRWNSVLVND